MRTAACLIAYNDANFVYDVLNPFRGEIPTFAFLGTSPWGKHEKPITKETIQFNMSVSELVDETAVQWWASEGEQRNAAMVHMQAKGFDYVWMVDADEIFSKHDIPYILTTVAANPHVDIWYVEHDVRWKTPEYRLEIDHKHGGIHILKSNVRFTTRRDYDPNLYKAAFVPNVKCKHLSYVRTDEQMLEKITNFDHAKEVRKDWYERVWMQWTPEMTNLHPIRAEEFRVAIKVAKEAAA